MPSLTNFGLPLSADFGRISRKLERDAIRFHRSNLPTAADGMAPAATVWPELQQLALGLAAVRRNVDQLSNQLAAGQQQMGADIAKLQADEQEIANKLSAAPRRTVAAVPKPVPVAPPLTPSGQAR